MSVCDVDLVHQSHISDEEETRFQMAVSVFGREQGQHNGGVAYRWGEQAVHLRRGVRLRLVNVGSTNAIERFQRYGYPVCTVCGQSVSPLSSDRQRDHFEEDHAERCGRKITPLGFFADITADAMSLPSCENHTVAYSVCEVIRMAAARVLDMHREDLQILIIGHVDREEVDALLWDPMPGGSGLLEQICHRFDEIVTVAREVVETCPSACETSCVDCLQTFRNSFYHKFLNRKEALERLDAWGDRLKKSHDIPPMQPSAEPTEGSHPVNEAERKLRYLLKEAGFEEGVRGEQIRLDRTIGTTTPDVIYRADHHDDDEGICIYMDGLSGHIHGNPATAERDHEIRAWLRGNGYEVIEIAASDLDDEGKMIRHFRKLAGYLQDQSLRQSVKQDSSWFGRAQSAVDDPQPLPYRVVEPADGDRNVTCIPLVPLKVAAGAFTDPEITFSDDQEWVEITTHRTLREGMFVAQVTGHSMEPAIPDGSYCLFRAPVEGSRNGKTVLVQLQDAQDPESGAGYTVKRYSSEKAADDSTFRHLRIVLSPINPEFEPIELTAESEGEVMVVAEMLEVLRR